jgi:hypothetical protein
MFVVCNLLMQDSDLVSGIIIHCKNFGDKDKLLHIITPDSGIALCICKFGNTAKQANLLQIGTEGNFAITSKRQSQSSSFKPVKLEEVSVLWLANCGDIIKTLGIFSINELLLSMQAHTSPRDFANYKMLISQSCVTSFTACYLNFKLDLISSYLPSANDRSQLNIKSLKSMFLSYLEANGLSQKQFPASMDFYKLFNL